VDCESQTETNSRQMNSARTDEQEAVRRLQERNRQLTVSVEKYKRKIAVLNEELENMQQDQTSRIQHVWYEEENQRQIQMMRDMRNELLWYKEQLPGIRMPTTLNG